MADVDGTELFDLFGETGFCTVCQANLEEGERIRAIEKCQHLFHADCLDPWLRTQNTCPLCRVEINQQAQQLANTYLANILTILEERLADQRRQFRRNMFQFVIVEGIMKKFPTAAAFNPKYERVCEFLERGQITIQDLSSIPLEVRNRTTLSRHLTDVRNRLYSTQTSRSRNIQSWPEYGQIRELVATYAGSNPSFQEVWQ